MSLYSYLRRFRRRRSYRPRRFRPYRRKPVYKRRSKRRKTLSNKQLTRKVRNLARDVELKHVYYSQNNVNVGMNLVALQLDKIPIAGTAGVVENTGRSEFKNEVTLRKLKVKLSLHVSEGDATPYCKCWVALVRSTTRDAGGDYVAPRIEQIYDDDAVNAASLLMPWETYRIPNPVPASAGYQACSADAVKIIKQSKFILSPQTQDGSIRVNETIDQDPTTLDGTITGTNPTKVPMSYYPAVKHINWEHKTRAKLHFSDANAVNNTGPGGCYWLLVATNQPLNSFAKLNTCCKTTFVDS